MKTLESVVSLVFSSRSTRFYRMKTTPNPMNKKTCPFTETEQGLRHYYFRNHVAVPPKMALSHRKNPEHLYPRKKLNFVNNNFMKEKILKHCQITEVSTSQK